MKHEVQTVEPSHSGPQNNWVVVGPLTRAPWQQPGFTNEQDATAAKDMLDEALTIPNIPVTANLRDVELFSEGKQLKGRVWGDTKERFRDGDSIYTSTIQEILCVTKNSIYRVASTLIEKLRDPWRPQIICLCGSTRFMDAWNEQRKKLTYEGYIVLAIEIVTTQSKEEDPQHVAPYMKARLDELHKRKIDLADEVLILNVGGYIDDSTRSEIEYALRLNKPVTYLEPQI